MDAVKINPTELRKGDKLIVEVEGGGWTAQEDVRQVEGEYRCDVQWDDGGVSTRCWSPEAARAVSFEVER